MRGAAALAVRPLPARREEDEEDDEICSFLPWSLLLLLLLLLLLVLLLLRNARSRDCSVWSVGTTLLTTPLLPGSMAGDAKPPPVPTPAPGPAPPLARLVKWVLMRTAACSLLLTMQMSK